jgi:hypothetical protein
MEVAIKRDLIVQNPARKVDKPDVEDPEIFPLTKELITLFDRILLTVYGRQRQSIAPA